MAKSPLFDLVSIDEYLAFEEVQPEKHELFRGRVYAMAGGSANHGEVIDSLTQACGRALKGKPCRFVGESRKVVVHEEGSGYYPDGAIACPPRYVDRNLGAYDNPTVVIEVLSPGTERFDRRDKADGYKALPSLRDYVLIESEIRRVEVFSRQADGSWGQRVYLAGTAAHLPSVGIDLSMDELYENCVFDDGPDAPLSPT